MKENKRHAVHQFLKKHWMHPDDIAFEACVRESGNDMLAGLSGKPVSFEMLPCYIGMEPDRVFGERPVLVLDAGGTNLRLATVKKGEKQEAEVEQQRKMRMPGVEKEVEADEMFDILAREALPFLTSAERMGFCFSYAMDVQENLDGKIRFICKSVRIRNIEGRLVGESLNEAIARQGGRRMRIGVVNDSVAVTLAAQSGSREYGAYIGVIIGTGFNICYAEAAENIRCVNQEHYRKPDMLINMEADKFFKMQRGTFDYQYAACTGDNDHPAMKMLSGAYLGGLCWITFLGAAKEGVVSEETGKALEQRGMFGTEELCGFLEEPTGQSEIISCCQTEEDAECLREIALLLVERASKLTAAILKAVIERSYRYRTDRPVCICVEGSTIQNVPTMKEHIDRYLRKYTDPVKENFELVSVKNATICGAAIAALQLDGEGEPYEKSNCGSDRLRGNQQNLSA